MMKAKTVKAHAKINLFLEVLSRRNDGFHEIVTLFNEVELFDTLNFDLTKKSTVKILSSIDFLSGENNLVYKVAAYLQKAYSVENGVEVFIEKNIPVGAGLGGGSSDAACALLALNELWNIRLPYADILNIAAKFGSDINFFISGGTAIGKGRGEKIVSVKHVNLENVLLVNPGFEISSKEAYNALKPEAFTSNESETYFNINEIVYSQNPKYCFNRLQIEMEVKYPIISEIIHSMYLFKAEQSILSGSGPTIIGFFDNPEDCKNAQRYFTQKGFWTEITFSLKKRTPPETE